MPTPRKPRRSTIGDSDEQTTEVQSTPETVTDENAADPVQSSAEPIEFAPDVAGNADHEDVPQLLDKNTDDGKGDEDVPESDFVSFATDDVEKPDKSVQDLATEVLNGKWGSYGERRARLQEAGHDPLQVETEVNLRRAGGAPTSHTPSVKELAMQVIRGEWGNENETRRRLESAGYRYEPVQSEVDRQLGN